jgi:hypothetical protein
MTLGLAIIIAMILSVYTLIYNIKLLVQVISYKYHPIYKAVSIYGCYEDVAKSINYEVLGKEVVSHRDIIITENWILKINTFNLNVINVKDVVWVYESITSHKQSVIAPGIATPSTEVAKTFRVVINTRNPIAPTISISTTHNLDLIEFSEENRNMSVDKRQRMVNIIDEIEKRNPRALFGYSNDLAFMWEKDKEDFINKVIANHI